LREKSPAGESAEGGGVEVKTRGKVGGVWRRVFEHGAKKRRAVWDEKFLIQSLEMLEDKISTSTLA